MTWPIHRTRSDVQKALTFKGATVAWAILKPTQDHREQAGAVTYLAGWIAAHVGKGAFKGDYGSARGHAPNCPSEEFLSQRYMGCIVARRYLRSRTVVEGHHEQLWRGPVGLGGGAVVCNVVEAVIEQAFTGGGRVPVTKGKLHVWVMDEGTRLRAGLAAAGRLRCLPCIRIYLHYHRSSRSSGPSRRAGIGSTTARLTGPSSSLRPPSWVDEAGSLTRKE